MSADNFLYVRKWKNQFVVEMRFASIDYDDGLVPTTPSRFHTASEAIVAAHRQLENSPYNYEYGVILAPEVIDEMEKEENTRIESLPQGRD